MFADVFESWPPVTGVGRTPHRADIDLLVVRRRSAPAPQVDACGRDRPEPLIQWSTSKGLASLRLAGKAR